MSADTPVIRPENYVSEAHALALRYRWLGRRAGLEVADLEQEAMLSLVSHAAEYDPSRDTPSGFAAACMKTGVSQAISRARSRRAVRGEIFDFDLIADHRKPEEEPRDYAADLAPLLDALKPRHRLAVERRYGLAEDRRPWLWRELAEAEGICRMGAQGLVERSLMRMRWTAGKRTAVEC